MRTYTLILVSDFAFTVPATAVAQRRLSDATVYVLPDYYYNGCLPDAAVVVAAHLEESTIRPHMDNDDNPTLSAWIDEWLSLGTITEEEYNG